MSSSSSSSSSSCASARRYQFFVDVAELEVFGKEEPGRLRCYGRSVTTNIPGCVGSNLASPIDASSAQVVRGTNLPHSSGSAHDSVLQKLYECCIVLKEDSTDFGL
ncbi:hypothetical protein KY289_008466 [Solanum tuberosum]|nr:hypothetical protein KY289_008466 [Solanum tuberosum]